MVAIAATVALPAIAAIAAEMIASETARAAVAPQVAMKQVLLPMFEPATVIALLRQSALAREVLKMVGSVSSLVGHLQQRTTVVSLRMLIETMVIAARAM